MDRQELAGRAQLDRFLSGDFDDQIAPMGTAEAIRALIRKTSPYRSAKRALDAGLINERVMRDFAADLIRDFKPGRKFEYETALAALAVLCESHYSSFAEELLLDLASLKLPEIGHAIRVARACLQHRIKLPQTRHKTFTVCDTHWIARVDFGQGTTATRMRAPIKVQRYAVA